MYMNYIPVYNHMYVHGNHTMHVFALWLPCNYVAT